VSVSTLLRLIANILFYSLIFSSLRKYQRGNLHQPTWTPSAIMRSTTLLKNMQTLKAAVYLSLAPVALRLPRRLQEWQMIFTRSPTQVQILHNFVSQSFGVFGLLSAANMTSLVECSRLFAYSQKCSAGNWGKQMRSRSIRRNQLLAV